VIEKIRAVLDELGLVNTILHGLDRAFVRLGGGIRIFRYELVAQPVPAAARVAAPSGRSFSVREIDRSDPALRAMPLTPPILAHRFGQPVICLGAFKGAELVAYLWLCLGPYQEDEIRCRFVPAPEGEAAWDFDVYVLPEHRLGRGFARLWDAANATLRARGVAWSMSRISAFNPGSIAAHRRLGARRLGSATFVKGRHAQLVVASLPPYVHFAFSDKRRPVIRLEAPKSAERAGRAV
jgi:hypothetical protein